MEVRPIRGGLGLFATAPFSAGEIIAIYSGRVVNGRDFALLDEDTRRHALQVEDDFYLTPLVEEPSDFVNHACDPSAWFEGATTLVARRALHLGDEITYDYATTDGSPYDEFECGCGAPLCRGRVSGDDWRRPELHARYGAHFSPYLLRRLGRR